MNTNEHFAKAYEFLGKAEYQIDEQDYESARASLYRAFSHNQKLIDHVGKLEALKANIELSES